MNSALEFLQANRVFHIASVDEGEARVRPFAFTMKRNDTIYFCTSKAKEVYRQMVRNPGVELSAMGGDGMSWLRVKGAVVFDETREAKAQVFAECPDLLNIYPTGADDDNFITFCLAGAAATLYSFTAAPQNLPLI